MALTSDPELNGANGNEATVSGTPSAGAPTKRKYKKRSHNEAFSGNENDVKRKLCLHGMVVMHTYHYHVSFIV